MLFLDPGDFCWFHSRYFKIFFLAFEKRVWIFSPFFFGFGLPSSLLSHVFWFQINQLLSHLSETVKP